MAMIGKVRRMHVRQKKSLREIARITSLSRNTIRKWIRKPVENEPKYKRSEQSVPDGHFKFPHLWPVKFPQAGRANYAR